MGKQINYWLEYEDFLQIAQVALNCGCIIIKPTSKNLTYGQTLDIVTEHENRYFFYVPEAGEQLGISPPFEYKEIGGYTPCGCAVIEAGFSIKNDKKKEISRSRLFVISGYYNNAGEYISRPDCISKIYNKLVRIAKKVAPYTEVIDTYISSNDSDYLQEREWSHKEYISPRFLQLKLNEKYVLCQFFSNIK